MSQRINYTSDLLEDIVLEVPWDEGFVPPPQIIIYVQDGYANEARVFHHRGDRPIAQKVGKRFRFL